MLSKESSLDGFKDFFQLQFHIQVGKNPEIQDALSKELLAGHYVFIWETRESPVWGRGVGHSFTTY